MSITSKIKKSLFRLVTPEKLQNYPIPHDEIARLNSLLSYDIMDTPSEKAFDDIAKLASEICDAPIAQINFIGEEEQFSKVSLGLPDGNLPRMASFCNHTIMQKEILEIMDIAKNDYFKDAPSVKWFPKLRFYAGAPITTSDGHNLGSLCVLDKKPGKLSDFQRRALKTLSEQIIKQLELGKTVKSFHKVNLLLAERDQRITDSINYAKNIQSALLPSSLLLKEILPEHFLLFKPKDVVSGDFYWVKTWGNKSLIAVADCTGHGIPGAFMSMLGMGLLNEICQDHCPKPNEILEVLREKVKSSLKQHLGESSSKDGMDMSLCLLDMDKRELQFAGAYNPLCIVRQGKINITKADRQPVAIYPKEKPFTNHTIPLEHGDYVYLSTDGFADQFNAKGDKFKSKNFRTLLNDIAQLPASEQGEKLENEFKAWKDGTEQLDDVTVLGFQVVFE